MNYQLLDEKGFYGKFSQFVPETLMTAVTNWIRHTEKPKQTQVRRSWMTAQELSVGGKLLPYHAKSLQAHRWGTTT